MNHQRLLRIFILTDAFCVVAGVIAAVIFEGTLPEPLRTYAATEELHPFLLVVGLILLVLLIVAWVGLWRSASWAPPVYAVMWIGCLVTLPFGGPHVGTGIEEMFDFVGTAAGGGILALLLIPIEERRCSRGATPVGTDTTSAVSHVARHNIGSIRVLEKCGFSLEREESVEVAGGDIVELVFVLR